MTTCTECGQPSGNRLCQECRLDRDHDYYERRAEEMGVGVARTGPDASDVHLVGGDQSDE